MMRLSRNISCSSSLFEHDLFGKPVSTFPDHALVHLPVPLQRMLALAFAETPLRPFSPSLEGDVEHRYQEDADRACREHAAKHRRAHPPAAELGCAGRNHQG